MPRIPPRFTFTVKGTGIFPPYLLFYDQCWPYSPDDGAEMLAQGERTITFQSMDPPTRTRWDAWGWRMTVIKPTDAVYHDIPKLVTS